MGSCWLRQEGGDGGLGTRRRRETQAIWEKREKAAKGRRSSARTIESETQMPMIDLNEEEGGEGCEREEVKVARRKELKKKAIWDRPRCPSSRPSGPRALEVEVDGENREVLRDLEVEVDGENQEVLRDLEGPPPPLLKTESSGCS
ncbi:hypothetical protein GBA52_001694 [Prunus armeniaca]|nr:hypothetical protein GBA52_001694 [Prunus armeniaca]